MRYDASELMIPPKFVGLSGNVSSIYLILYMCFCHTALSLLIINLVASFRRLWLATDYVVMFSMALVSFSVIILDYWLSSFLVYTFEAALTAGRHSLPAILASWVLEGRVAHDKKRNHWPLLPLNLFTTSLKSHAYEATQHYSCSDIM